MKAHWLAGAVLFALGFGSALLVRLPAAANTADVAAKGVPIEGTPLEYVDGSQDFRVRIPAGVKTEYLVTVARKPGPGVTLEPQISAKTGEAVFSKKGLQTLTVFEVKPLIQWQSAPPPGAAQKSLAAPRWPGRCEHPQIYCVLPPPPGPPIHVAYSVVRAQLKK